MGAQITGTRLKPIRKENYLSVFVVDHDVVWLNISVHDSHTVAIVQGL